MKERELKEKIASHERGGNILEAFTLQSAYIESLLFAGVKSALAARAGDRKTLHAVEKQIDDYTLSQLIEFSFEAEWLPKEKIDLIHYYRKKRNGVLRDFTGQTPQKDFEKKLSEAYYVGGIIIAFPEFLPSGALSQPKKKPKSQPIHGAAQQHIHLVEREGRITDRENKILKLRMADNTYEEIGEKIGITKERVRQILNSAISKLEGNFSGLQSARSAAKTSHKINNLKKISVEKILSTVCRAYNISRSDLLGDSRLAELVLPRHLAIYFLRENLKLSFPRIAKIMGRDHATVIHACEKIEHLMKLEKILISPPGTTKRGWKKPTR